MMRFAIIGCGYVADMYMQTLPGQPGIEFAGAWDHDPQRLAAFSAFHRVRAFASFEEILNDPSVGMVVNLTNPRSHHAVSRRALEAGKHLYSEKPLGMTMQEAEELAALAAARGLGLGAAPCNHMSDPIRALGDLVRGGTLGRPLMAHAEMDDGNMTMLDYPAWRSISGAPWPARDEFEVGCTLEHAGYQIGPLVALFGPVRAVTGFCATILPDKGATLGAPVVAPDLSIGVLEFAGGVPARLTCSILAPADRSLRVVFEHGVATVPDVWEYHAPLLVTPTGPRTIPRALRRAERLASRWLPRMLLGWPRRVASSRRVPRTQGGHRMDFARGIADLARRVNAGGAELREAAQLALHITEVTLALTAAEPGRRAIRTAWGPD